MHKALQGAAGVSGSGAGSAPGGVGGASNFDLASWMAGAQKSQQQGAASGADVREGGARRR
jgi:hypothetical protein